MPAASADPVGFVADLPPRVILDEVQHVPHLFAALKCAIDRDRRPGRFILTGSTNVLLNDWQRATERDRTACDLGTAAFFQTLAHSSSPHITTATLFRYLETGTGHGQTLGNALALSAQHRFFHWPLEFPEVFRQGGFDVVLSNPPWEQIELEEQEFFATRNPALWTEYREALHAIDSTRRFLHRSGRFPRTGKGRTNSYAVFAELARALLRPDGRAGLIVPTGIATDDTTKHFFRDLVERGEVRDLEDPERRFTLSAEDFRLLNPNTGTAPIFRTPGGTQSSPGTSIAGCLCWCTRPWGAGEPVGRIVPGYVPYGQRLPSLPHPGGAGAGGVAARRQPLCAGRGAPAGPLGPWLAAGLTGHRQRHQRAHRHRRRDPAGGGGAHDASLPSRTSFQG